VRSLGRCALTDEIGRGSMGTVYRLGAPGQFLQLATRSSAAAS
jgi:hypothetical protein